MSEDTSGYWLVVKNNLYYRPDACGYTAIRDQAGHYLYEEAKKHANPDYGVTMIRLQDAPEVTSACYSDIAQKYYQEQIASLRSELERARSALRPFVAHGAAVGAYHENAESSYRMYTNDGYRPIPVEDFRRARAFLANSENNNG